MVKLSSRGDFSKTTKFLQDIDPHFVYNRLDKYGQLGVEALRVATPKDTGKTADSWDYTITVGKERASITWTNSNTKNGIPIALLIQYGHGMPHGGYVQGIDYINPALKPIFDAITDSLWKEVKSK